jgi:YHS domain-containing protein
LSNSLFNSPNIKNRIIMNFIKISFVFLIVTCCSSKEEIVPDKTTPAPNNTFSNVRNHSNLSNGNLALQGYDPVSYIETSKAVMGNSSISSTHDDILYYFSSPVNKTLFDDNPSHYVPQYGGWCATGMALNFVYPNQTSGKYKIDPLRFSVENGKLYLFYNFPDYDAYPDWVSFGDAIKIKATETWNEIIQ